MNLQNAPLTAPIADSSTGVNQWKASQTSLNNAALLVFLEQEAN